MNFKSETSFQYNGNAMNSEYPEAQMPQNAQYMMQGNAMGGCSMPPVYECPQERVINREFVHEVPHICPINTRIINHHIYRHTYTPCYTCCEENECCNVYEGSCCNF